MEKRLKTHPSQWAVFLDFAEKNPQIVTKKFDGSNGRKKYDQLWEEIAEILNGMGYLRKTVDKWQKAVADWKSKVKSKAADLKKGITQTGGGGPLPALNENERRLISILGTTFITGIETNKELGLDQENKVPQTESNPALPKKNTNILPQQIRLSPPPLSYCGNIDVDQTSTISNATSESAVNKIDIPPVKLQEKQCAPKKRPRGCTDTIPTQKIPSTNLTQMHKETLNVLNQINTNIEKMANSQERLAEAIEKLIKSNINNY